MNTGITFEIQDYLANQVELLELISGEYVRKGSGEVYEANLKHLFPGNDKQAKLINPGSYIAGVIYDWFSSYVGEPKENQNINYIDVYEGLLTTGYLRLYQNVDTKKLESIKTKNYYYDKTQGKEFFINIFEKKSGLLKKNYLLVETFSGGIFERKLFELTALTNLSQGTEVPLETLDFLSGTAQTLTITGIDRLVIEKQVERPILEKIKTIIFSIEKKLSEIDKNFLDYTEQFKVFRNLEIPDNAYKELSNGIKVVDFDSLGKVIQTNDLNGTTGGLEIVKNTNDLLIQSISYIDDQIRSISSITGIPLFAFGIKGEGGNDSGTSKIKSAGLFYKKVEKYRDVLTKMFYEFWKTFNITEKEQILEFGEIVTSDIIEIIEAQTKMLEFGIQSKKRAIMKTQGTDEVDAQNILNEIQEEKLSDNKLLGLDK